MKHRAATIRTAAVTVALILAFAATVALVPSPVPCPAVESAR